MQEKNISIRVTNIDEPVRIDKYIFEELCEKGAGNLPLLSRSKIQSLIKDGDVLLNSKPVKKNVKLSPNDFIELNIPEKEDIEIVAEDIPINIVYEDDDLIVVNKERGMVVHPAIGNYSGTLVNAIMYHLNNSEYFTCEKNASVRPGVVHRIDKDTTGLLMLAKNDFAHRHLSEQLKNRTVNRRYVALVHGGFKDDEGRIDAAIGRSKRDRLKMAVDLRGKPAATNYKVIERMGKYTLLELKLETGRTHQIRVHMKYIKHPVVGDKVYGAKSCKYNHIGQLLHAKTLGFVHPKSGEYMEFNSQLPEDFANVLSEVKR